MNAGDLLQVQPLETYYKSSRPCPAPSTLETYCKSRRWRLTASPAAAEQSNLDCSLNQVELDDVWASTAGAWLLSQPRRPLPECSYVIEHLYCSLWK